MGFFGLGKKREVVDLGERYRRQQERTERIKEDAMENSSTAGLTSSSNTGFDFLGSMAGVGSSSDYSNSLNSSSGSFSNSDSNSYLDLNSNEGGDKKRKLAKRLIDMTDKIEDLSNQIYHLQQRIEVLEKKSGVGIR